jgi:hypothetical protein
MSSIILTGDTSGTLTVSAPLVAGSNTVTLPAATGTISLLAQATAVASTSGTSIDFTGIPSWAKRITVMLSGVSTSGTSRVQLQIGDTGGVETSSYANVTQVGATPALNTTGFLIDAGGPNAAVVRQGSVTLTNLSSNTWVANISTCWSSDTIVITGSGSKTLSDVLDRVRITTVNGTDTFDAGSINIIYEG